MSTDTEQRRAQEIPPRRHLSRAPRAATRAINFYGKLDVDRWLQDFEPGVEVADAALSKVFEFVSFRVFPENEENR